MKPLYRIGRLLCIPVVHLLFNIKSEGIEKLPKEGGYILVCNHRSNLDPIFLSVFLKRQINYMAKSELFKTRILSAVFKGAGAFPVVRGSGDTGALDYAAQVTKEGKILGLFPEGKRNRGEAPGRARSGVVIIAARNNAPIIPAAIKFGGELRFRTRITVRFGEPINQDEIKVDMSSPSTIRTAAKAVMGHIVELLDKPQ